VAWTVHRLHAKLLTLGIEHEHIILEVLVVPRCLPEINVVYIRCDDLLEPIGGILTPDEVT
jgi:hypothetical protein